jgi:alkylmercury lyase
MLLTPADDARRDLGGEFLTAELSPVAIDLAVAGFAAAWEGREVEPTTLVAAPAAVVTEAIETLVARGRCEVDDRGRLAGIHGLTLRSTRHSFVHGRRVRHTWCAFDAIGIPAALGIDAVADTDCRSCHQRLQVRISAGRAHSAGEPVLWLPAPTGDHLMNGFCANADLYCSTRHLRRQIDPDLTPGHVTDLATAAAKGVLTWADVSDLALDRENGTP